MEMEGGGIGTEEIQMTAQPVTGGEDLQRRITHPGTTRMAPLMEITMIGHGVGEGMHTMGYCVCLR